MMEVDTSYVSQTRDRTGEWEDYDKSFLNRVILLVLIHLFLSFIDERSLFGSHY